MTSPKLTVVLRTIRTRDASFSVVVRRIRTRDLAMVALINGATKAAIHVDRKKQVSRRACRGRVRLD